MWNAWFFWAWFSMVQSSMDPCVVTIAGGLSGLKRVGVEKRYLSKPLADRVFHVLLALILRKGAVPPAAVTD
jgi:hypothetical protein